MTNTPTAKGIAATQMQAVAALKEAYQGRYSGVLAYALRVSKGSIRVWFNHRQPIPLAREIELVAYIDQTIERCLRARKLFVADIAERERHPKRRKGMLVVRDHGDGLPPHNQQAATLKRLGLKPLRSGR